MAPDPAATGLIPLLGLDRLDWGGLLRAELRLTGAALFGILLGEAILSTRVADRIFAPLLPRLARWRIPRATAQAMALSLGTPRAGAALLASAYAGGEASREEAVLGTLCLSFPAYLRRWITTAALASSLAGLAGALYAGILLLRSGIRFVWLLALLRRSVRRSEGNRGEGSGRDLAGCRGEAPAPEERARPEEGEAPAGEEPAEAPSPRGASARARRRRLLRTLAVSLPCAWLFFALTYALMPVVERFLLERLGGTGWLPASGWTVVAAGLSDGSAAMAAAGGATSGGSLTVAQALLALLLGNLVGTFTRVLRQNVGYWMGIFPRELMRPLLIWHLGTLFPLGLVSVIAVAATIRLCP